MIRNKLLNGNKEDFNIYSYAIQLKANQYLVTISDSLLTYEDLLPISDKTAEWFWFRKNIFKKLNIYGCVNLNIRFPGIYRYNVNNIARNKDISVFPNASYVPTFHRRKGYGSQLYLAAILLAKSLKIEKFEQHTYYFKSAKLSKSAKRVYSHLVKENYLIPQNMGLFYISQKEINLIQNKFDKENIL